MADDVEEKTVIVSMEELKLTDEERDRNMMRMAIDKHMMQGFGVPGNAAEVVSMLRYDQDMLYTVMPLVVNGQQSMCLLAQIKPGKVAICALLTGSFDIKTLDGEDLQEKLVQEEFDKRKMH